MRERMTLERNEGREGIGALEVKQALGFNSMCVAKPLV